MAVNGFVALSHRNTEYIRPAGVELSGGFKEFQSTGGPDEE